MCSMIAAGITELGGAVNGLELPDPPPPASGEAVIEVRAAGVANWDDIVRTGGWDTGAVPPMALGVEAAGVIAAVGPDGGGWAPGDAVLTHPLPLRHQGTWSERLLAPTHLLARKPDALSWEQAAVLPVPALTADQALDAVLGDASDAWLLVNGAGGVTGRMVAALGVLRGARVIAVAGPASAGTLATLGVEHVLDRRDTDWPAEVRRLTAGTGVSAAINAARGGEAAALTAVADGGALGTITGGPPPVERGVTVTDIYVRADGERLGELAQTLESSGIELEIGTVLPLARAAEALELAIQGRGGGAIVLTPS
jgi:NADPH:quinone reductase-like Zn-dependent oxidoreductase